MILKMLTPHCIKQDSSRYTTALGHCIGQSNIFKVTLHGVEGISEYDICPMITGVLCRPMSKTGGDITSSAFLVFVLSPRSHDTCIYV